LDLPPENYSHAILKKVVFSAAKNGSFAAARENLQVVGELSISANEVRRIAEHLGQEWQKHREAQVKAYKAGTLRRLHREHAATTAAVMLDGGRVQTRTQQPLKEPHGAAWKQTNVACLMTMASEEQKQDPAPQPPKAFLRPERVKKMVHEIKAAHSAEENSGGFHKPPQEKAPVMVPLEPAAPGPKPAAPAAVDKNRPGRPRMLVKSVVATMQDTAHLGWLTATAVHQRGLDLAPRKACVCDGQQSNWNIYETHLRPMGFLAILDVVHLVTYLYAAAMAAYSDWSECWGLYCCLLTLAWKGQVDELLKTLRERLGQASRYQPWRKKALRDTIRYIENNRDRMNYPEYRRLGLPTSSAYVESTIKQINKRIKGSEKFWRSDCCDAMLGLTSTYIGNDDAPERMWKLKRPHRRACNYGGFALKHAA
jgi:hypothetical protein